MTADSGARTFTDAERIAAAQAYIDALVSHDADGVPDFGAELVASSVDGDTEWGEWYWHGHHVDGSPFALRGATIFVVRDGRIAEGRLYMEPVETNGGDIEAAVQELYKPQPEPPHRSSPASS